MICFLALIAFALLSVFSAKHRPLARAAFDCVFRRVTLRPCDTGLDEQVKSGIVAALLARSPPVAKFVNRHFEAISWAFTLLFLLSTALMLQGLYNFVLYGTCDPANPSAFCPYRDLLGGGSTAAPDISSLVPIARPIGIVSGVPFTPEGSVVEVTEVGCFSCPYTKRAEEGVRQLLAQRGAQIHFTFVPFPLPTHNNSRLMALAALCAADARSAAPAVPASVSENLPETSGSRALRAALFAHQDAIVAQGMPALIAAAQSSGQPPAFYACLNASERLYGPYLDARIAEAKATKLFGTPTFFIGGKPLVGPVTYEQLSKALDEAEARP